MPTNGNGRHDADSDGPVLDVSREGLLHAVAEAVVTTKREGEQTRAVLSAELAQQRTLIDGIIDADVRRWKAQYAHNSSVADSLTAIHANLDVIVEHVTREGQAARARDSLTEEAAARALAKAERAEEAVGAVAFLRRLPKHPAVGIGLAFAAFVVAIMPYLLAALKGH